MVKEVLLALRKQLDSGTSVIHGEWGRPATTIPSALLFSPWEKDVVHKLHETLHGPVKASCDVQLHALEVLDDHPCLAVEEVNWGEAMLAVFPQARRVPLIQALVHDALQMNRQDGHHGMDLPPGRPNRRRSHGGVVWRTTPVGASFDCGLCR